MIGIVISLMFGLFAACMINDQFSVLKDCVSIIDRKQGNVFKKVSTVFFPPPPENSCNRDHLLEDWLMCLVAHQESRGYCQRLRGKSL